MVPAFLVVAVLMFGMGASMSTRITETVRVTQLVTVRETVTITQAVPIQTVFTGKILTVRLGEAFTVTMDKQLVEVKFVKLRFESQIGFYKPASGYRFAVIDLEYRNLASIEARADWGLYKAGEFILKVSTGYSYKIHFMASNFYALSLKPGTTVAGHVCFEIPSDSIPTEMHIVTYEWSGLPEIVLNLG
jgi:hypothetical protein